MLMQKPSDEVSRVLMTADTIGGVWTYAIELAEALGERNVEVILATMGDLLSSEQRESVKAVPNIDLFESLYKLEWMEDPWQDVKAAGDWLLGLASFTCPDVIHLNGYVHAALPWRSPVLVVGHSCVYSWFSAVKGTPPPPTWRLYRSKVRRGLETADLVTAPTSAMLSYLRSHYCSFGSFGPIYNGRKASKFPPGRKEPFVLTAGRLWDEAKNAAALEGVASDLKWPLFVAGANRRPEGGEKDFRGIEMLGKLTPDQLASWLGRAAIFSLPARYEPFGLCALEAGLAGCALVLGDIPSLREVWGDAASFVKPEDPDDLRKTITLLIEDAALRRQFSERARSRALRYSPERMASGYLDAYAALLNPELAASMDCITIESG